MPYYKCTQCHHEFEHIKIYNTDNDTLCDWCGAPSSILEEKIPLERLVNDWSKKYLSKE